MPEFDPKIVAFVCNWCTYAGADLTGTSRMKYSPQVSIIRFPCTGRIDFMLLLKAFANGADYIVVGRPILDAPDPRAAALEVLKDMAQ